MTQPFADALTWMPKSRAMGTTLSCAFDLARARGAAVVTLEHLLIALTEDADAAAVLKACGVDSAQLSIAATEYVERTPVGDQPMPDADPALIQILQYAVAAARQSRRNEVNGAIVLAAIVGEGSSEAAKLLTGVGLTFQDTVKALQQANSRRANPEGGGAAAASASASAPAPAPPAASASVQPQVPSVPQLLPVEEARHLQAGSAGEPAGARGDLQAREPVAPQPARRPEAAAEPTAIPIQSAAVSPPKAYEDPLTTARRNIEAKRSGSSTHPFSESEQPPPAHTPAQSAVLPEPHAASGSNHPAARGRAGTPAAHSVAAGSVPDAESGWVPPPRPAEPVASRPLRMPPPVPTMPGPPPLPSAAATERRVVGHVRANGVAETHSYAPPWPDPNVAPGRPDGPAAAGQDGRYDQPAAARSGAGGGAAEALDIARLADTLPLRMRDGVAQTVEIRISRAVAAGLSAPGEGYRLGNVRDATLGRAVIVRLRSPDRAFAVEQMSPECIWLSQRPGPEEDESVRWRWLVTPRRRGYGELRLAVSARMIGTDGHATDAVLPEQGVEIALTPNWRSFGLRIAGFTVAALVGAVAAFGIDGRLYSMLAVMGGFFQ